MRLLLITATLFAIPAVAEEAKENCGCAKSEHSRAAQVTGQKVLSLKVIGMSCVSCEADLQKKLEAVEGVLSVDSVDHAKQQVTVTTNPNLCESIVKDAITKGGYLVAEK